MGSLHCSASLSPSQIKLGFHPFSCRSDRYSTNVVNFRSIFVSAASIFRYENDVKFQRRRRLISVFTSNATPSEQEALTKKSNEAKADDAPANGPPVLTILAGFLVLALLIWIFGSTVIWLLSLVFNLPASK